MKHLFVIGLFSLVSFPAFAVEPPGQEPIILDAIHNMRMKQEQEENVYRVIQTPMPMNQSSTCNPVDRARDRLNGLSATDGAVSGSVNIQAGHENVTVESNEGTVNNSVNVQIVSPNEENCL